MQNSSLKRWVLAGFIIVTVLGAALHFVYRWSNESPLAGAVVPVNESIWEHFKMGYLALLIFSVFEYLQIRHAAHNYWLAKFIGIICLQLSIVLIYYGYVSFAGKNILWIDILSYVVGVFFCQLLAYHLYTLPALHKSINAISLAGFLLIGILFAWYTFHPPHFKIFRDQRNDSYGIPVEK